MPYPDQTFKNVCGEYRVQVTLEGEQPITTMRIVRENKDGGRFLVRLKVNTKVIFTRVDNPSERFEFSQPVTFEPSPYHRWGYRDLRNDSKRVSELMVDTDWDGTPDTLVPGVSNFAAGRGSRTKFEQGESVQHDAGSAHQVVTVLE